MSALAIHREEWPEADFDLPDDDEPLHTTALKLSTHSPDDDEDWDMEMDFGQTGGAKAQAVVAGITTRSELASKAPRAPLQTITIRPPLLVPLDDLDEDDEGISTIKAGVFSKDMFKTDTIKPTPIEEDMECDFELPSDLTRLSLVPKTLTHRPSQSSFEWGDKDHTSSSQSSDAFSSLGFADGSSNSNSSASSVCIPSDSEDKESRDEDDLDGLVLPSGAFESAASVKQLTKLLELKKKIPSETFIKVSTPDPEDDFEAGLVFEDDIALSPSRLITKAQKSSRSPFTRSQTVPPRSSSSLRPPSRTSKFERSKSPSHPPPSSTKQLNRLRLSPSPPPRLSRSQGFGALSPTLPLSSQSSFLTPKPGSLRSQKSYNGLKPPTPPSTVQRLARKASLSSLMESSPQASGSGAAGPSSAVTKPSRYETPTAASRAKVHKGSSTSRMSGSDLAHVYGVPPARPSTPSSSSVALRLTMPTLSRSKSRPALSAVFTPATSPIPPPTPRSRATSPLPPRPPSSLSLRQQLQRSPPHKSPPTRPPTRSQSRSSLNAASPPPLPQPKLLRRPKRSRTYGDGTELDSIADLPTDREKEGRYRVPAKGRVVGGTYSSKVLEKAAKTNMEQLPRPGRREGSSSETGVLAPTVSSLRRSLDNNDLTLSPPKPSDPPSLKRKKTLALNSSGSSQPRKKPTLIRNLGGAGPAKVVGDMKWNPKVLRWEGNDQVLRDFDVAVGTSARPALITQLTGSSMGSPVPGIVSGARIVGNMMFDPSKMCWVSTLSADEDEPDVFADLADDEDESWETKGGTIRAALQNLKTPSAPSSDVSSVSCSFAESSGRGHVSSLSDSSSDGFDRGCRPSMVCAVDEAFISSCRKAEARHRAEMKGWRDRIQPDSYPFCTDRPHLYEIRALATRKY